MRLLKRGLEHQALTQANQSTRLAGQMLEIGVNAWHPQADNMQVACGGGSCDSDAMRFTCKIVDKHRVPG